MNATAPALLAGRVRTSGAGPLLTFYDDATGERVELSAISFANWVSKTANLLVDGLGLGPGDRAAVALPLHWQALAVVAGCWQAGLMVELVTEADASATHAAVAFATPEGGRPSADELLLLALTPMGGRLRAPIMGASDYAAEVPGYGDRYVGASPAPADEAMPGVSHATLCGAVAGSPARVLLAPSGDPNLDRALVAAAYLSPLVGGGSAVLCRNADPNVLERRRASERVDTDRANGA